MTTPADRAVCTACGTVNRLPQDKPASEAKCGGCGALLFSGEPADVSGDMLQKQIARSSVPVVVDVWAPWCGPCRVMAPEYEKAAQATEPRARFLKLNSDNEQELSARLGIRGIPTMLVYRDGKEIARTSGARPARDIIGWIDQAIG
jgi:thioredoxin 2